MSVTGRMLPAALIAAAAAMLGGVWADACEKHSRLAPVLVTTAKPRITLYAWPEESVELHCRPSQAGGCRWVKGSTQLGTDCRLRTTQRGTIKCLRGEETCGSVEVNNARSQKIEKKDWRQIYGYYNERNRYMQYSGQTHWSYKSSTFLCSKTGTIVRQDKLCDGTSNCNGGEDEWNCKPPCGPPFVGEHSALSSAARDAYPDGSQVTYVCHPGFSFGETLSGLTRTCRAGRWTAPPPVCRRNVALNRTIGITGRPMAYCGTAVDGALDTWCILAPSVGRQALAVRLPDNATVTTVLVRSLSSRYEVVLRDSDQIDDDLSCSCQESNDGQIHPAVSGVRVCSCPEQQTEGRRELLVRAESGAFMSLSVAEIVALEASDADVDECTQLGHPAHGRFESAGPGQVKLSCDPGHSRSCSDAVQCSAVRGGDVRLSCLAASCPQPPAIANTRVTFNNGTDWRAVAEYDCATGYVLYPADQNTTAACDSDGLWTIGHITCLSETDIRVVAMRLGQQHARSMATLRAELQAGLQQQQQQLQAGQQRLLAELNSTQHRLAQLERDVSLLGLAEGTHLQLGAAAAAESGHLEETATEPAAEAPEEGDFSGARELEAATEPEEPDGSDLELSQLEAADGGEAGPIH